MSRGLSLQWPHVSEETQLLASLLSLPEPHPGQGNDIQSLILLTFFDKVIVS